MPFLADNPVALSLAPVVFMIKTYIGIFVMMWIRGTLPRIRIDQMLSFALEGASSRSRSRGSSIWACIQRLVIGPVS